jgi:hypothetical protein
MLSAFQDNLDAVTFTFLCHTVLRMNWLLNLDKKFIQSDGLATNFRVENDFSVFL